jgi:tetraacyldisaccharide 4'-kinase
MKRPWLAPFVPLYAAGVALRDLQLRNAWKSVRGLRWPVISVGNLSAGGAGKTPLTITLARLLKSNGFSVDVLSRGYGRESRDASGVRPDGTAAEFGDEPILIAREAEVSVYVAPERYDAGVLAEAEDDSGGRRVHILDDGFQHRRLARDVDILILNRADLWDMLLPAGNLREPLRALRRADVIAIPSDDVQLETELSQRGWSGPIWRLHRHMEVPSIHGTAAAFCGIARPDQFFSGLEAVGLRLVVRTVFRDHYRYTATDVSGLVAAARAAGASALITTEKDRVRLGTLSAAFPQDLPLTTAQLRTEIENETVVIEWLIGRLAKVPAHQSL